MRLRPYQTNIIERTRGALRLGKKAPLIVSPCGSGKTVMFSYFASRVVSKGKRPLILAHREELLEQISGTLSEFNVHHQFIAAGRPFIPSDAVQVASVFSAVRRLDRMYPPDIIIIDEAHHSIKGSTWGRIIDKFPKAIRIGVTATPERLSGEALKDMFDEIIIGPSVSELIDSGDLSPYKLYAPSTIDTSSLHTRAGDFAKNELVMAADKPSVTGDAIKEYRKFAENKRAIVFCVSIDHAKHVSEQFMQAGYAAGNIDGKMSSSERKYVVNSFRNGDLKILTSCDIISEGFDLPAIECAIMLRPTKSLALWIQQSGRALRPYPGKERAIILDHAGNCMRHGLPDEDREWSLNGREKTKGERKASVRICPSCFAAQPTFRTSCLYCKFEFPVTPRAIDHVEGELVEAKPDLVRRARKREQAAARTFDDLVALGKSRNYKNPYAWAKFVFNARQGRRLSAGRTL